MKHVLENGLELNYNYQQARQAKANTRTLVLIHGMGFDLTCWDRIIPYMQEDFHLLRYDFRGHGLSGTDSIDPSRLAQSYVEHLNSLVQQLGIGDFHIVSHGAGCIIGLYYTKSTRLKYIAMCCCPCHCFIRAAQPANMPITAKI